MKNKILIFLYFSFICTFQICLAQNKIDSLTQVLKTLQEDTNKANTLNLLIKEYYLAGDYEQSKNYSKKALQLCDKINFEKRKVSIYLNTGAAYFYDNNYSDALNNYSEALSIAEKLKDKTGIANCYNNMALVYSYQRKYADALKLHFTALKIYQDMKDTINISRSNNNIGIIYDDQGNHPEALKYYYISLKFAEKLKDNKTMGDGYLNIGHVYVKQSNFSEATKNYDAALKLYEEIGFKRGVGICYSALVRCYASQKEYTKALETNEKAIEILESIGDKLNAAVAKDCSAYIHIEQNNYSDALEVFFESLKAYQEIGEKSHMASSYSSIAYAYYGQKQYDKAIIYFKKCISLARTINSKDAIVYAYRGLAELYELKNDYKNALDYHKLYFGLNDSLFNETRSAQITEMKTRYETEHKDNEITLLNKDNEIQNVEIKKQKQLKYSFIGGMGLVIVLLLFGYRAYRTQQALRLQDIRNKIAGDLHDDIGSTLNSISVYSEVARRKDNQQDEALEMIGDASRKIIDAMSDIVWTVNPENDSFAKIIFRMKSLAYNLFRAKKIEFTFQADEELNEKKLSLEVRRNFYLIFKEAINNLVKYSNATRVAISLTSENKSIRLRIQDDGIGFDPSDEITGNGLKNMKRRADEMKAEFKIESSKGNGTRIELVLVG